MNPVAVPYSSGESTDNSHLSRTSGSGMGGLGSAPGCKQYLMMPFLDFNTTRSLPVSQTFQRMSAPGQIIKPQATQLNTWVLETSPTQDNRTHIHAAKMPWLLQTHPRPKLPWAQLTSAVQAKSLPKVGSGRVPSLNCWPGRIRPLRHQLLYCGLVGG